VPAPGRTPALAFFVLAVGAEPRDHGAEAAIGGDAKLTIHLVRHGETDDNAVRRFQLPEARLSENGRAQAAAVAETLAGSCKATFILASDYERTQETARIIGARLGLPVLAEPALRERNFGVYRGQLYADLHAQLGEDVVATAYRSPRYRIEEGESWADVFERVNAFLSRLRAEPPAEEMILVSHGGTMNVILQHLEGCAIDDFALAPLENCAVRTLVLEC
jgi:probable phosphoglycerate mutase